MITSDSKLAIAELQQIAARTANMQPFMAMLAEFEVVSAKTRIAEIKTDPSGSPWAPWSKRRREERIAKGNAEQGLLFDTGTLLNSIYAKSHINGFEVGTDLDYAVDLQDGTFDMPARPFLGWTLGEVATAERLAVLFIEKGVLI